MPPEKSLDDFSNPKQLGTYELWRKVIEETKIEKKAKILLLDHGDEALAARINLIRSSKKASVSRPSIGKRMRPDAMSFGNSCVQ